MNAVAPSLQGTKISSSDPNSKIDFLDLPGNVKDNGVLAFIEAVLIPISKLQLEMEKDGGASDGQAMESAPEGTLFSIPYGEQYGGIHYKTFKDLEDAFGSGEVHPSDLKIAVANAVVGLLEPIF